MSLTEVYVYKNSIFIIGKIKDLRKLLAEYAKHYNTVNDLINAKLNSLV